MKSLINDQVTPAETAEILHLAEQCLECEGDFVELGCYRGDTSVLLGKLLAKFDQKPAPCGKPVENLCKSTTENVENIPKNVDKMCKTNNEAVENRRKTSDNSVQNPSRHLWIYDSFAGLPAKTAEDNSGAGANFKEGELLVTKKEVIQKIRRAGLHNVVIKKAWFDDLKAQDLPAKIAFAFLDGDLYGSIKTSLKLVVPRLTKRGIIIVHDYNNPELPGSARAVDEFLRAHPNFRLQIRHSLAIITQS